MFEDLIIKPLIGAGDIKLLSSFENVVEYLRTKNIQYSIEVWPNKGCDPEEPWTLIKISNIVTLFFAKNKLWKLYFEEGFIGTLENGVKIGMTIEEAKQIDPSLKFDDWEEDYVSSEHYWIEESLETNKICSISIYIEEAENDNLFFSYKWAK